MKVLLDTCVLSELRRKEGQPAVKAAVAGIADDSLFLSVMTIGEIVKGIALIAPGRKKQALSSWLSGLEAQFADRIMAVDLETVQLWGDLSARAQKAGIQIPAVDGLIAATALQHGMHVMTRNTRHFEASGAIVIDPFDSEL